MVLGGFGWFRVLVRLAVQDSDKPKRETTSFPGSTLGTRLRERLGQTKLKMAEIVEIDGGWRRYVNTAFDYKQWVIFILIKSRFYNVKISVKS